MKIISWNIDGLNSALENKSERGKQSYNLLTKFAEEGYDIICLQETKLSSRVNYEDLNLLEKANPYVDQYLPLDSKHTNKLHELFPDYHIYYSVSKKRKGYSGTMVLSKVEGSPSTPNLAKYDDRLMTGSLEGRITTVEFDDFYLVNVYTPNSGGGNIRLPFRQVWDAAFTEYLADLKARKATIVCGDMNVAHTEIDLKNPKKNVTKSGFTPEERAGFQNILDSGFIDTLRLIHGDTPGMYTWFTQLSKTAKLNNSGWRLDYFLIDSNNKHMVVDSAIYDSGERKDHSPIILEIEV